jgi:hypothetical protein
MEYQFDGWDYTELFDKWHLYVPAELYDNDLESSYVHNLIHMMFFMHYNFVKSKASRVGNRFYKDCRNYCKAMLENYPELHQMDKELWLGLIRIKDDYTFMRYFNALLEYAWS